MNEINKEEQTISCDVCGHEFFAKTVDIKQNDIEINGKVLSVTYFICSNCGEIYIITILDKELKALQQEYQKQSERWAKILASNDRNEIARKQGVLTSCLAKRKRVMNKSNALKQRYKDAIKRYLLMN